HKLERWALVLSSFPHTIECLPGEDNVWGDLLSFWSAAQAQVPTKFVRRLLVMVSPLQQPDFDWPSFAGIVKTQQVVVKRGETPPTGVAWNEGKNLFLDKKDRIWIPPSATDLQQRVCIIAHQGAAGHRRIEATTKAVRDVFGWSTLEDDVKTFVQACIRCLSVDGSVVPRPLGSALHAEKPQELIHFDWLSMPTATNGLQKILVIKDDMRGFVRLWPSETSDGAVTANGLLDWFTTFG
ncbi:hypothetical protein AaE_006783, partial [Aphanomyces astaci]